MLHCWLGLSLAVSALGMGGADVEEQNLRVERAARRYRVQTYQDYRLDRAEYDRRRQQGDALLEKWKKAGEPAAQRDAVAAWFEQAPRAPRGEALPATPEPLEALVLQPVEEEAGSGWLGSSKDAASGRTDGGRHKGKAADFASAPGGAAEASPGLRVMHSLGGALFNAASGK